MDRRSLAVSTQTKRRPHLYINKSIAQGRGYWQSLIKYVERSNSRGTIHIGQSIKKDGAPSVQVESLHLTRPRGGHILYEYANRALATGGVVSAQKVLLYSLNLFFSLSDAVSHQRICSCRPITNRMRKDN